MSSCVIVSHLDHIAVCQWRGYTPTATLDFNHRPFSIFFLDRLQLHQEKTQTSIKEHLLTMYFYQKNAGYPSPIFGN